MKKTIRKSIIALAAVATVSICALPEPAVFAEEEKVIQLLSSAEPPTLDPGLATDSTSSAVLLQVFEGLTSKEGDEVVPGIAEEWDVSEDGLTYTFHLRESVWSNGDPVKAQDFEFAWRRVLNPETASEYANIMYDIKGAEAYNLGEGSEEDVGIKALDDYTLEVQLEHPTAYFPELVSFYTYYPVHQASVEADGDWGQSADDYISNGAFLLSEWNHDADYLLEKNPEYWDADNVALDRVEVQIVESEPTMNLQFQNGELAYLGSPFGTVALDAIDSYRESGELQSQPYSAIYWYKLNTTDEHLQNVNIRKALALAINRQELIDQITKGGQEPAMSIVPISIDGFEEDPGYFEDGDYDQARDYLEQGLEELGLEDASQLELSISINTSEAHAAIAQYVQEEWHRELGIDVTIDNTEWQVYLEDLQNLNYQVGRLGWIADYNDASTFLDMYRTAETGNNDTGWESEEYKELLDASNAEQDPEKRLDILKEAQAVFMDEMPVIPLYFYVNNYVVAEDVVGMEPNAQGNIYLKDVDLKE